VEAESTYAINSRVNGKYAITIYEIGYMPSQFNQMPKLNDKFPISFSVAMTNFYITLNCNDKFPRVVELQWQISN
jgi:hypothetical protein